MFDDKSETLSAKGEWRGMKESGGRVGGWATARGFPTVDLFKWIDKSRCHLFLPPFLSLLSIRSNRPREQLGERFRKTLMSILLLAITFTRSYEKYSTKLINALRKIEPRIVDQFENSRVGGGGKRKKKRKPKGCNGLKGHWLRFSASFLRIRRDRKFSRVESWYDEEWGENQSTRLESARPQ